jgi:hypothetical protein
VGTAPVHGDLEVAVAHKEFEVLEVQEVQEVVGRRGSAVGSLGEVVDTGLAALEEGTAVGRVGRSRDIAGFAEAQVVLAEDNRKVAAVAARVVVDSSPGRAVVPDSPAAGAHHLESLASTGVVVKTCRRFFVELVRYLD